MRPQLEIFLVGFLGPHKDGSLRSLQILVPKRSLIGAESIRLARTKSVAPQPPTISSPTLEQSQQIIPTPLAFLNSPAEAGLTAEQSAALAQIGDDFVKNVGGPGQDPTDPAYRQKWQNALSLADERGGAVAGQGAYEALINQRAQAAGDLADGQ